MQSGTFLIKVRLSILASFIFTQNIFTQHISPLFNDVYKFSTPDSLSGTCFRANFQGKTYLMTCAHILPHYVKGDTVPIIIKTDRNDKITPYIVVRNGLPSVDLIIMHPANFSLEKSNINIKEKVVFNFRTECLMLGYPGILPNNTYPMRTDYGTPQPFVKGVRYAGRIINQYKLQHLVFDGYSVAGFSGSPIVFFDNSANAWKLLAINLGFLNDPASNNDKRITSKFQISVNFNAGLNVALPVSSVGYLLDPRIGK